MGKKTFKVKVNWDTDNEKVDLPEIVEIPIYIKEENYDIANYLSNRYGWLVKSYIEIK